MHNECDCKDFQMGQEKGAYVIHFSRNMTYQIFGEW